MYNLYLKDLKTDIEVDNFVVVEADKTTGVSCKLNFSSSFRFAPEKKTVEALPSLFR